MFEEINNQGFFIDDVRLATQALLKGGVILYPTDTVWGLGCMADNVQAIQRVYKIKQRYEKKNLIILVNSKEMLVRYVHEVPEVVFDLIESYKKPLTVVYPKAKNLPALLIANDQSIAIRIVKHPFCIKVIDSINVPLVSTSANISGQPPATTFSTIPEEIKSQVDYIAMTDRNRLHNPSPSTIIKVFPDGNFVTIRD